MSHPYQPPGPTGYAPQQPYAPAGYPGTPGIYQLRLTKHTGAMILWFQQTVHVTGTRQQCEAAYRDAQTHCLAAGWWSVLSFFLLNWIALIGNMMAIRKIRTWDEQSGAAGFASTSGQHVMAAAPGPAAAPAGWYPDPSGQPGQRYFDGGTWTNWTHPPAHG